MNYLIVCPPKVFFFFYSLFELDLSKAYSFDVSLLHLPHLFVLVIFVEEILACGVPPICL